MNGRSQLPRTKTIRVGTPKTTMVKILILGLTSPFSVVPAPSIYCENGPIVDVLIIDNGMGGMAGK